MASASSFRTNESVQKGQVFYHGQNVFHKIISFVINYCQQMKITKRFLPQTKNNP